MSANFRGVFNVFTTLFTVLRELNSDEGDRLSQMRVCGFMVVTTILGVFVWKNLQAPPGIVVDFPTNGGYLVSAVVLGKVAQKYVERKWHSSSEDISEEVSERTPIAAEPCPKSFKE